MCLMAGLAESSETESYCSNTDRTLEGVSSNSSEVENGSVRTILKSFEASSSITTSSKEKDSQSLNHNHNTHYEFNWNTRTNTKKQWEH